MHLLSLIPHVQLHPKETREKAGATYKFTGTLIVDREGMKPTTLRKVPPQLCTALEKTLHSRTLMYSTHYALIKHTYAPLSRTTFTHRSLAPHSYTALEKHGTHASHSPHSEAWNKFLEVG